MKNKREILTEQIMELHEYIHELRRTGKDYSAELEELTKLIVELDDLRTT